MGDVARLSLSLSAQALARAGGDDGCVIITVNEKDTHIGVYGLTSQGLRNALCLGINYAIECPEDLTPSKHEAG